MLSKTRVFLFILHLYTLHTKYKVSKANVPAASVSTAHHSLKFYLFNILNTQHTHLNTVYFIQRFQSQLNIYGLDNVLHLENGTHTLQIYNIKQFSSCYYSHTMYFNVNFIHKLPFFFIFFLLLTAFRDSGHCMCSLYAYMCICYNSFYDTNKFFEILTYIRSHVMVEILESPYTITNSKWAQRMFA